MAFVKGLSKISDFLWEIPPSYKEGMLVPARIFASEKLLGEMDAAVIDQLTNVATLPGIVDAAYCMPDGHSGYGFPIGGVAAMDARTGVISPGGIGFDINCGMRLAVTGLTAERVKPRLRELVDRLYQRVPAGVGAGGFVKLSDDEFREVAEQGARWCLQRGFATPADLALTEDGGCVAGADSSKVSQTAIDRGLRQIGTLGSGNHYLEIQVAHQNNIYDQEAARGFGITLPDQILVMFHCGSRGFGHQVASDYLEAFLDVMEPKYKIRTRDRELACAPFRSPEGQAYFAAMKCAVNMSYANRQVILHRVREVFAEIFGEAEEAVPKMIYDVAHNTARLEEHRGRELLVHRKGATRAFAGKPVIIGGSMETGSYLLTGIPSGAQAFFSTAHGSGRTMSRHHARKLFRGKELAQSMLQRGIYVKSASYSGLAEEAGGAYKDIDEVIAATERAGLSRPVVKLVPLGNVKG